MPAQRAPARSKCTIGSAPTRAPALARAPALPQGAPCGLRAVRHSQAERPGHWAPSNDLGWSKLAASEAADLPASDLPASDHRLRPPPLPTQELDRDDYVREFVKNAATLWEGNWAQAGEALSSKQRVSAMRDEAQREQGESVLDAMQQRHAQVTLAPTLTLSLTLPSTLALTLALPLRRRTRRGRRSEQRRRAGAHPNPNTLTPTPSP